MRTTGNRFDQFRIARSERKMGAVSGPNNTAGVVLVDVQSSRQSCGLPRVGNDETDGAPMVRREGGLIVRKLESEAHDLAPPPPLSPHPRSAF